MICKACNKVPNDTENDDCFEKALDVLKKHYAYYKNSLQQRDLELQQIKERNEQLVKALQLLQKDQQPTKRFKSQHNDLWVASNCSQEDCVPSDLSLTDDEHMGVTNLNMALNSEQLFDTSALSQTKNDVSTASSSEIVLTTRIKESPKRNKQRDVMRGLKCHKNKGLERSRSEWRTKERNSPVDKCWATKFLQPTKANTSEEKFYDDRKKTTDKKLCLSLKKANPAKIKQSLLPFNVSKDTSFRESDVGEDMIDASPVIVNKNSKAARSWAHRSGHLYNSSSNSIVNEVIQNDDGNKSLDDIVFDFSPSKKTDLTLILDSPKTMEPKRLKFDSDSSKDCISLPNENLGISTNKSDSSSVVILTPVTQDIIFVDDTEIDTMDLLSDVMKPGSTDNLEILKKYESKCIQNQHKNKDTDLFKKPSYTPQTDEISIHSTLAKIKQETITKENVQKQKNKKIEEEKPSCSKSSSNIETANPQNPLFSSDDQEEEDEAFMPKPFIIKQESESSKPTRKVSIKQRFNIECEDCEKLINFLDDRLTDTQIQQHLDKCKRHNNPEILRQNTPKDFWNPFILSFQADDPRNEVLIDNRFKDN